MKHTDATQTDIQTYKQTPNRHTNKQMKTYGHQTKRQRNK